MSIFTQSARLIAKSRINNARSPIIFMLNESRHGNVYCIDLLARSSIRIDIFRELLSVTADVKGLTRAIRGRESGRVIVFVCLSSAYCFRSHNSVVQDGDR